MAGRARIVIAAIVAWPFVPSGWFGWFFDLRSLRAEEAMQRGEL